MDVVNLTFGDALAALKAGKRAIRKGWNGEGMFVFLRPACELNIKTVVDDVRSLPDTVKDYYRADIVDEKGRELPAEEIKDDDTVTFSSYLCLKVADGSIVNGWLPSQLDLLSEDWIVLD